MTAINQDFSVYAGDAAQPQITVTDGSGAAIPLSGVQQITWTAKRDPSTAAVITKTLTGAGGITFATDGNDGVFLVTINDADTAALTGFYIHSAVITDADGNLSSVTFGRMGVGPKPIATYSGDPANSNRDYVRDLIGDTAVESPLFFDATLDNLLTKFGNPLYAAAQACRSLAARYAGKVNKRVGDLSINYGDLSKSYTAMAAEFKMQADLGASIYVGGISKADMSTYSRRNNPDNNGAFTSIHAFDNRGASGGFAPPNIGEGDET